jgi:hippurate hydrolase
MIDAVLGKAYPRLDAIYKDIHSHPEIGFHEVRTAALLAQEMHATGFEVVEKFGGSTGLVAVYRNGAGPTVLVRTELDALPMEEKTGLPYASKAQMTLPDGKTTFIDHACGHDIHMAWWLGTARALVELKSQWRGTLVFIAQPAEEIGGGATGMLQAGLFTRFPKPDFAFAAHVHSGPAGNITIKDGVESSNSDTFKITFKGRGGHGSTPDLTIDPIVMAARFVMDVQTIISREKAPGEPGVISVGSFHAGSVGNIIPDQAEVQLTMRSLSAEVRAELLAGVQRTANAVAQMASAESPVFERIGGGAMSVVNDSRVIQRIRPVIDSALGGLVSYVPAAIHGGLGTEDYSEFVNAGVPASVFFGVGGQDPAMLADHKARGIPIPGNHSPLFAPVPEPTIKAGATVLTLAVLAVTDTSHGT